MQLFKPGCSDEYILIIFRILDISLCYVDTGVYNAWSLRKIYIYVYLCYIKYINDLHYTASIWRHLAV